MTNDRADRLKLARERAGFETAADAARRFGWRTSTYAGHENGSRGIKPGVGEDYARAFRVPVGWLMYGTGSPDGDETESNVEAVVPAAAVTKLPDGWGAFGGQPEAELPALIPIYNVSAAAGHGAVVGEEEVVDRLAFPPGYLRRLTDTHPRHLVIIEVMGDSMAPTVDHKDIVMLDTSKRDVSYDGIFVFRDVGTSDGNSLQIKRIGRGSRRGYVMLISDNKNWPLVERAVDQMDVIGRVIWMGTKV